MRSIHVFSAALVCSAAFLSACSSADRVPGASEDVSGGVGDSVIFIHPDGAGINAWAATRMLYAGPDADLHWDRLPHIGIYRGHLSDALAATSNAGGTIHAYGLKVRSESFGNDNNQPLVREGLPARSVAREAMERGKSVAIISTAGITDAGTGTFFASAPSRKMYPEIAAQMLAAGPQVMLGGGESYFLPKGVRGRHGEGIREDGRDLIGEARAAGYTVVFTDAELAAVPPGTRRLLGLFAAEDTFADDTEENKRASGEPYYRDGVPSIADMLRAALPIVSANPAGFLIVAEEEGSDNFAGENNARGMMLALKRADEALGVARAFAEANPRTFLLTCADSDCGGMQVVSDADMNPDAPLPARDEENGAPLDGRDGAGTPPFLAAPDRAGRRIPFAVGWASEGDVAGAVVVRGFGRRAGELITPTMDNTAVYTAIRRGLFGE